MGMVAFTFQDQDEIGIEPEEIEIMLRTNDQVAKTAYSRRLLNQDHVWANHSTHEVDLILSLSGLKPGNASVLDFGCGTGRHALELALKGFDVAAVDYLDKLVDRAREKAAEP